MTDTLRRVEDISTSAYPDADRMDAYADKLLSDEDTAALIGDAIAVPSDREIAIHAIEGAAIALRSYGMDEHAALIDGLAHAAAMLRSSVVGQFE